MRRIGAQYGERMRTRSATVLSIGGVLAAGLVAALVNAQALASSGGRANTSLASIELGAESSVPASATTVFMVGTSGTLTLDDVNGVLDVVAIAPASGWSVSAMTSVDDGTVVVDFASVTTSVRATAVLRNSRISVEWTETTNRPPTTVGPATSIVPTTAARVDDGGGHGSDDVAGSGGDSPDD